MRLPARRNRIPRGGRDQQVGQCVATTDVHYRPLGESIRLGARFGDSPVRSQGDAWCNPGQVCFHWFHTARRWTSQTVAAISSADSARSQPPSIHWNGQNRLAGW
jgi:hypothetical protein